MEIEVDKAELLKRIEHSYEHLEELLSRAALHDTEASGVCGEWSVKDIVAHLIAHEQRTLAELNAAREGRHLDIKHDENDSFNDGAVYAYRAAMFEIVRSQLRRSHEHLIKAIKALDDADFNPQGAFVKALDDTVEGAVANNTYEHYDEHSAQIEAWVKQQEEKDEEKN